MATCWHLCLGRLGKCQVSTYNNVKAFTSCTWRPPLLWKSLVLIKWKWDNLCEVNRERLERSASLRKTWRSFFLFLPTVAWESWARALLWVQGLSAGGGERLGTPRGLARSRAGQMVQDVHESRDKTFRCMCSTIRQLVRFLSTITVSCLDTEFT